MTTSTILARWYKFPPCSLPSFPSFWWRGCRGHTKINFTEIWSSFDSTIWIKLQSWTKNTHISPARFWGELPQDTTTLVPAQASRSRTLPKLCYLARRSSSSAHLYPQPTIPTWYNAILFPSSQPSKITWTSFPPHMELLLYTSNNRKEAGG